MNTKKVLHVINISFVTKYFFGYQFKYLNGLSGNKYYLACSPSDEHNNLSEIYNYEPVNIPVTRSINIIQDLKSIIILYNFIKTHKIDVVVGHTPKGGMIAMIASYLACVNQRVYFRHGIVYETSKGLKRYILKGIECISGALAKQVVCVSNSVKYISEKDHLNNPKKNIVLGLGTCNGVDSYGKFNPELINNQQKKDLQRKLSIEPSDFVVGYVGRLVNDKGIPELLKAWKLILKDYANIKLLLVGPFEERDGLNDEDKNYIKNEKTIIHTGLIDNSAPYLNCMNLLVLPTYREGFPTVVLEASSMKVPVLVTRATGCAESIKDGYTGYFITHEPTSISNKIKSYIQQPLLGQEQGSNGRRFVLENFDQKIIWDIINNKLNY